MPAVRPFQFFGLEFTEKFELLAILIISLPIGVNRLIGAACLGRAAITALLRRRFKYRQRAGARWSGRSISFT
ncbi:hypothetical protein XI06_30205 [Bradyrhizobium sp. CCBAU 11434]|nr:hypothetical protein [Bradyrhizobium sp. CCBAU 11434]